MIRSDELVALDEINEMCETAADHFQKFADSADIPQIADMFSQLSQKHRENVAELDGLIRQMGELPNRPDLDRETIESLATWLRTVLAGNKQLPLLDKALEIELELLQKINSALQLQQSHSVKKLLQNMQRNVRSMMNEIKSVHTSTG